MYLDSSAFRETTDADAQLSELESKMTTDQIKSAYKLGDQFKVQLSLTI